MIGTRLKVIEVVLDKMAYGWSPEEMHLQHPDLSLAQIHGALAHYYEKRRAAETDALLAEASDPVFRQRLIDLAKQHAGALHSTWTCTFHGP